MSDTLVESSAESAFLDLHKKLLEQGRPALVELQEAALNRFELLGFPHSKHEMYTFVNIKGLVATSLVFPMVVQTSLKILLPAIFIRTVNANALCLLMGSSIAACHGLKE